MWQQSGLVGENSVGLVLDEEGVWTLPGLLRGKISCRVTHNDTKINNVLMNGIPRALV